MSKLGLVILMVLMAGRNNAQNYPVSTAPGNETLTYFVLIQSDGGLPFYVRLNNRLYRSSPAGHVILSRLKDSAYSITVGFPGQIDASQRYILDIRQRDWALRLSLHGDRWGLYDSRGSAIHSVADSADTGRPLPGVKRDDPFSQMMSAVVQDTAVMYSSYADASPDSASIGKSVRPLDTTGSAPPFIIQRPGMTRLAGSSTPSYPESARTSDTSATSPTGIVPSSPTGVIKLSEHRSSQSLNLLYADHPADNNVDTIDVLIPIDPKKGAGPTSPSSVRRPRRVDSLHYGRPLSSDSVPVAGAIGRTPLKVSADSTASGRSNVKPDTVNPGNPMRKPTVPFVNSDCHAFATEYDVDKLRVRLLNTAKEVDRIQIALKVFKTKCFTTKQIHALTEMFTTDASKFQFLTTAYPYVSDDSFGELVKVLSDPGYIGKFRAMTDPH